VPAAVRGETLEAFLDVFVREVNVKQVEVVASDEELVRLSAKPNFRTLGKVYGKDTPAAAQAAGTLSPAQLRVLEGGETVEHETDGRRFTYRPEDIVVERRVVTDWLVQSGGPYVAALDPTISDDLRDEGLAREIVNRVQRLRKEAGYDYNTRIDLGLSGPQAVLEAARAFSGFIAGETLARQFDAGSDLDRPDLREAVDIDGHALVLSLRRHDGTESPEPDSAAGMEP
jgi:isoleucyl-tRNA synthetase